MSDLNLTLRLTADDQGFTGTVRVGKAEVERLNQSVRGTRPAGEEARRGIDQVDEGLRNTNRTAGDFSRTIRRATQLMGAFLGVQGARTILANTIRQEQAMVQLETVVRSTGGAAGITAREMADMADQMQSVTTYGNEAVMEMQALLATFTQVRGDVFRVATASILDMATAMRMDLRSAAQMVGRALNEPIQGMTALQRAGVQLSESQRDAIKEMVEMGNVAGAQRIILAELETQFGGSARAARETLGGALVALREAVGDLFKVSADTGLVREAIEGLIVRVVALDEWFSNARRSVADWAAENERTVALMLTMTQIAGGLIVALATVTAGKYAAATAARVYTGALTLMAGGATSATAALLTMRGVVVTLVALFAGWQLGRWASENFEVVERAGIRLASWLHRLIVMVRGEFQILGEDLRFALTSPLDYARNKIAGFLEWITGLGRGALRLLGLDDLADGIEGALDRVRGTTAAEHKAMLHQMRLDTGTEMAGIAAIYADMFTSVGQHAEDTAEPVDDLRRRLDELKKALGEIEPPDLSVAGTSDLARELARVRGQIDPAAAATQRYTDQLDVLHRAHMAGLLTLEEYADLLWLIEGRMDDAGSATGAAVGDMADDADVLRSAWQRAIEDVDRSFVDLWESALQGTRRFMDQLQASFRRLLAELAHAAITRPIMVRVGMAGALGAPGGAAASGGGGAGGGVGLLQRLTGGNQIGMAAQGVGDWLFSNTSLPVGGLMEAGQIANWQFGAAGLLGGLGANLIFGGRGQSGLGGSLGSMAGLAIGGGPVGAVLGGLLGGGIGSLFGGKPSNRAAMADIDLGAGAVTGLDQMRGDKAPGQETLAARDQMAELMAGAAAAIGNLGGQLSGGVRLDIGGRDGIQVDWGDGLEHVGEDLDEALGAVIERLMHGADGLDPAFAMLTEAIQGGERRVAMLQSLGTIRQLRGTDVVGSATDAWEASQRTISEQLAAQAIEARRLAAEYDGSVEATHRLAEAYGVVQAMTADLTVALLETGQRVDALFGDLAERIRMDMMAEQELYDYQRARVHDLAEALGQMTDPQRIEATSREIERLMTAMWSGLDNTQRQAMGDEFAAYADWLREVVQSRIEDGIEQAGAVSETTGNLIDAALRDAAHNLQDAGRDSRAGAEQFAAATDRFDRLIDRMGAVASGMERALGNIRVNVSGSAGGEINIPR